MVKLVRWGPAGEEKPGMLDADGGVRDLSGEVADIAGDALLPDSMERLKGLDPASLPKVDGEPRLGPCVGGVGKIMAIGLNYSDHAAETGAEVPPEPIMFMKATSAISGAYDPVILPRGSQKGDWEVELAAVIGKPGKYVSEADALDHVAGYCTEGGSSTTSASASSRSSAAGSGPRASPPTPSRPRDRGWSRPTRYADPQKLDLWCAVNGTRHQDGNTDKMVYGVVHCVSYLSNMMSLRTGDIITTGTPPGVGMGLKPQQFLKPGDVMELSVEGLGVQRQEVVADD